MRRAIVSMAVVVAACCVVSAAEVTFSTRPTATKAGERVTIRFAVSAPTDVEVAVLGAEGKVVRHLAAGVLGGPKPPPGPLMPGLSQTLEWDLKDDFGRPVRGETFRVRVRAGTAVTFGRFVAEDPYNVGRLAGSVADEDGNLYVLGFGGMLNQGHMTLRVFDAEGRYLREVLPFPANLPPDAVKGLATWDGEAKTFRLQNHQNLNPDFYGHGKGKPLTLVSASKKGGVVLTGPRAYVLETTGAVRSLGVTAEPPAPRTADLSPFQAMKAKYSPGKEKPSDFNRMAVDYGRDEVYVLDAASLMWRFDGTTGQGGLLKKDGKPFYAGDVAVGYDGLLYVRKCMGYTPGVTDFSGPLERYTRDLSPAPYPSGTNVLSKYIYGRYGIGYADRGIGVGPDGTVYTSFMYDWVKYCTAGFGPDGKALKGKYLEGKVGGVKRGYPPELTSAVIGPITAANGGVCVDLKGNIYLGLWVWPRQPVIPKGFEKDEGYKYSVGSVVKFPPEGGFMAVKGDWLGADPIDVVPATPGAAGLDASNYKFGTFFIQGATAIYQGLAPFSHSPYAGNTCCVCRVPRFDVDRYGRLAIPNAVTNSVLVVDNAGNLILEFGRYGNFDSQYVNPNLKDGREGKPTVATPDIPLAWPTGAGFSEKHIYVNDTYSRRVVRADLTSKTEETCEVK